MGMRGRCLTIGEGGESIASATSSCIAACSRPYGVEISSKSQLRDHRMATGALRSFEQYPCRHERAVTEFYSSREVASLIEVELGDNL